MDRELAIKHGLLRVCDCGDEFTDRKEFKAHMRATGHTQNTDGRDMVKKPEGTEKQKVLQKPVFRGR